MKEPCMGTYKQPDRNREAYTGETIVMPERRREMPPAPQRLPRPARRPLWPRIRTIILIVLALALVALILFYLQIRGVASRIVVSDVRPNTPVASPFTGLNVLIVGVDERPGHPEEGVRGDTLVVVHLDAAGRWA